MGVHAELLAKDAARTKEGWALTGVALLVVHHSAKQKVVGLIPGQGTCLDGGSSPGLESVGEATDGCFLLFLPPFLYL